jgi:hypothetical protein
MAKATTEIDDTTTLVALWDGICSRRNFYDNNTAFNASRFAITLSKSYIETLKEVARLCQLLLSIPTPPLAVNRCEASWFEQETHSLALGALTCAWFAVARELLPDAPVDAYGADERQVRELRTRMRGHDLSYYDFSDTEVIVMRRAMIVDADLYRAARVRNGVERPPPPPSAEADATVQSGGSGTG